jgi:guanyl-specific ribonuclease Sa
MPGLSRRTWTALLGLAGLAVLLLVLGRLAPSGSSGVAPSGAAASSSSAGASGPTSPAAAGGPSATRTGAIGTPAATRTGGLPPGVPAKVLDVLRVVDETGQPPRGYVGGRQFFNDGRGGTSLLPRRSPSGAAVQYHEYDVNPRRSGVNRGPQRLVVGDDGSAYYTPDHYETWVRIR